MLVLTRRRNQGVVIATPAGNCRVVVLGVERDRVKLGFEAPDGVSIMRDELAQANAQLLKEITDRVGIETPRNVEVVRRALNKAPPLLARAGSVSTSASSGPRAT